MALPSECPCVCRDLKRAGVLPSAQPTYPGNHAPWRSRCMKSHRVPRALALLVGLFLLTASAGHAQQPPKQPDPPDACDLMAPTITGAGVIMGTDGNDVIHGSEGDDTIDGGDG